MTNKTNTTKLPKCKLTGEDSNVFSIIGKVSRTLQNANRRDKASEFRQRAMSSPSYNAVLCLCMEYVDVR